MALTYNSTKNLSSAASTLYNKVTGNSGTKSTTTQKTTGQSASNSSPIGVWKDPVYEDDYETVKTTTTTKTPASSAGSSAANPNNKVSTTKTTTKTSTPASSAGSSASNPNNKVSTTTTSGQSASKSSAIGSWKAPTYEDDDSYYYNVSTPTVSVAPASSLGSSAVNPNNKVSASNVVTDSKLNGNYITKNQFTNSLIEDYTAQKAAEANAKAKAGAIVSDLQSNGVGIVTPNASDLAYWTSMNKEYGSTSDTNSGKTLYDLVNTPSKLATLGYEYGQGVLDTGKLPEQQEADRLAAEQNKDVTNRYFTPSETDAVRTVTDTPSSGNVSKDTNRQTAGAYKGDLKTVDKTEKEETETINQIPTTVDDYAKMIMDIINGGGGTTDIASALAQYGITMPEAVAQAMEALIPQYKKNLQSTLDSLKKQALKGGFYGQLPAEALYAQAVASNEGDMQKAIYDLALQIYESAQDTAIETQKVANDTAESKVNMLMQLLDMQNTFADREAASSKSSSSGTVLGSTASYNNDGLSAAEIKKIQDAVGDPSNDGKYSTELQTYLGGISAREAYTTYVGTPIKSTVTISDDMIDGKLKAALVNDPQKIQPFIDWCDSIWSKISLSDRKKIQTKLKAVSGTFYDVT